MDITLNVFISYTFHKLEYYNVSMSLYYICLVYFNCKTISNQ